MKSGLKFEEFGEKIILEKHKKVSKTKFKKILITCATALAVVLVGVKIVTSIDWQMITDENKAKNYNPSSEIKSLADSIYLTRKGKSVYYASQPKLLTGSEFNKTCGRDGYSSYYIAGCYYKDDNEEEHIEIYNVGTSTFSENGLTFRFGEYRKAVVLHETLHAVWERFSNEKKNSTCKDLKTLASQISNLKSEVSTYSDDKVCSELFARVGSEYTSILSPNNTISTTVNLPVNNNTLSLEGKKAINNLVSTYNTYFDTTKYDWLVAYWENNNQLVTIETKIKNYNNILKNKERNISVLKNAYYYWPTRSNYNSAVNAIKDYNNYVTVLNSYLASYKKVVNTLDSERAVSTSNYLSI